MTEPFDGLEPNPASLRRPQRSNRGTRIVYGIVAACVVATVGVGVLEAVGIEVWPRHEGTWRRFTYKIYPDGRGSSDVFYCRVDKADAERLGDYLSKQGHFDGPDPISVYLTRRAGELQVSFFRNPRQAVTPDTMEFLRDLRGRIAAAVFGGAPLTLNLCDPHIPENSLDPQLIVHASFR